MPKTRQDFMPYSPPWLVEDWFPLGHRCMDTAPEGSFKTIWGCWLSVCIAAGYPVFGQQVKRGNVLIVDEETPEPSLNYHLDRFSRGLGFRLDDLPIYIMSMEGFRFGRKGQMRSLLKAINSIEPVFIRFDSLLAMLPGGRQFYSENDCHLGEIVRDELNQVLSNERTIMLAAHSKKFIAELGLNELQDFSMQGIVRGHGSIVGEGCDTGYVLFKISEHPKPTRFCIMTKVRRQAIPAGDIRFIEMKEEKYGWGWARLEEVPMNKLPPSDIAKSIYHLFSSPNKKSKQNHSSQWIVRTCALLTKRECKKGIEELLERKVLIPVKDKQSFILNPFRGTECDKEYLETLKV